MTTMVGDTPTVCPETRAELGRFFGALFAGAEGRIEFRCFPSKARLFALPPDLDGLCSFLAKHVAPLKAAPQQLEG